MATPCRTSPCSEAQKPVVLKETVAGGAEPYTPTATNGASSTDASHRLLRRNKIEGRGEEEVKT